MQEHPSIQGRDLALIAAGVMVFALGLVLVQFGDGFSLRQKLGVLVLFFSASMQTALLIRLRQKYPRMDK